jgi:small GTP-binding protein
MSYLQLNKTFLFKIILFGESGSGKTTLIRRLEKDKFEKDVRKTIGVNFAKVDNVIKNYYIDNIKVRTLIWDFSGEKRFHPYFKMWLRGTMGGIFLFDLADLSSFENYSYWINLVRSSTEYDFPIYFVGSKSDLSQKREVSKEIVYQHIDNKYPYFECSSKSGENVERIFRELTQEVFKLRHNFQKIKK